MRHIYVEKLECSQIRSFRFYEEEHNQQSFHYTFWDTLYLTFLKVRNPARLWPR